MNAAPAAKKPGRRKSHVPVVSSLQRLDTTWTVVSGKAVVLQMYDHTFSDPDAIAAAKCWKRHGFDARVAHPDDYPPEVPEGMIVIHVPVARFDAFAQTFVEKMALEHQYIYATIGDVWAHDAGEVTYEDLPVGKSLLTLSTAA